MPRRVQKSAADFTGMVCGTPFALLARCVSANWQPHRDSVLVGYGGELGVRRETA